MRFLVTFKEERAGRPKVLHVDAEAAHDVRHWALARFQGEEHSVELDKRVPYEERCEVMMRWEGSDAGARPNRKLVVVEHLCFLCYGLKRPVQCDGCGGAGYLKEGCRG